MFVHHFLQIFNKVMIRDLCQNFVSLKILRTNGQNLTKFCIHINFWQDLGRDCYASFFADL